jgi:hypothetical protein
MAMGSVHARGDTFLTFGLKALTETNTSRLATGMDRNRLWNVLETYNFTGNLISAIKSSYKSMIIHI